MLKEHTFPHMAVPPLKTLQAKQDAREPFLLGPEALLHNLYQPRAAGARHGWETSSLTLRAEGCGSEGGQSLWGAEKGTRLRSGAGLAPTLPGSGRTWGPLPEGPFSLHLSICLFCLSSHLLSTSLRLTCLPLSLACWPSISLSTSLRLSLTLSPSSHSSLPPENHFLGGGNHSS